MKSKHIKNIAVSAVAGKAALTIGSASAQTCLDQPRFDLAGDTSFLTLVNTNNGGKGEEFEGFTEATIYQTGLPSSSESAATINMNLTNLTNSKSLDVYVAYSTTQVTETQIGAACVGEFLLDTSTLKVLDGFKVNHPRSIVGASETPLGTLTSASTESIDQLELQLNLNTLLDDPTLQTNEVFLQVIAFESGGTSLDTASVSTVQKITLNRDDPSPSLNSTALGSDGNAKTETGGD